MPRQAYASAIPPQLCFKLRAWPISTDKRISENSVLMVNLEKTSPIQNNCLQKKKIFKVGYYSHHKHPIPRMRILIGIRIRMKRNIRSKNLKPLRVLTWGKYENGEKLLNSPRTFLIGLFFLFFFTIFTVFTYIISNFSIQKFLANFFFTVVVA